MEKYTYIDSIDKFNRYYFGPKTFIRVFARKAHLIIGKAILNTAFAILVSVLVLYGIDMYLVNDNLIDALIEGKKIENLILVYILFIILIVAIDFKIFPEDRIKLFKIDIMTNKRLNYTDLMVVNSKILKSSLIKQVKSGYFLSDVRLISALIKDSNIDYDYIYQYFEEHVDTSKGFSKLNHKDQCLYFAFVFRMGLEPQYSKIYQDFFKNEKEIEEFTKSVFKEKAGFFINTINMKLDFIRFQNKFKP